MKPEKEKRIRGVESEKFRLAIDAVGCKYHTLEAVNDFLIQLAATIKVKIRSLTLLEVKNLIQDKPPGIMASVLFLESSMVLHVSPENEEISLDIFLYHDADVALLVNALEYFYQPRKMNIEVRRNISTSLPLDGS